VTEFASTRDEKPPKSETSVVYDPRTGRIVYVHEFIGDGTGLYGPDGREERARIALKRVKRHHKDAERFRVMHLPRNFRFKADTLYRVDLRTGRIAALPVVSAAAPAGRRRSRKKGARS
jgi:hypothetical protein